MGSFFSRNKKKANKNRSDTSMSDSSFTSLGLTIDDDNNSPFNGSGDSQQNRLSNGLFLNLVPHVHTLFCERKSKVCEIEGKIMQFETLEVDYDSNQLDPDIIKSSNISSTSKNATINGGVWMRGKFPNCNANNYISKGFVAIQGTDKKNKKYVLTAADIGYYIIFIHEPSKTITEQAFGPVLAAPSQIYTQTMNIYSLTNSSKRDFSVGQDVVACCTYVGGNEGNSEYWWLKVGKDGQREVLTDPMPVSKKHREILDTNLHDIPSITRNSRTSIKIQKPKFNSTEYLPGDPRVYRIKQADIGCTLKVKCRPIREDSYRGDVVTSLPTNPIKGK